MELGLNKLTLSTASALALLALVMYRRYMSPLRSFPGPFVASFTRLWHVRSIWRGDQNLEFIRQHEAHGHFVRVSYDEISCTHPDAIKMVLLNPLHKSNWYKNHALPDYRFQSAMSLTDPKKKVERSRCFAAAFSTTNALRAEPYMDKTFVRFFSWLDRYAGEGDGRHEPAKKQAMEIDKFFSYTTFDVVGEFVFSTPFGFLQHGRDVGHAIHNTLGLNLFITIMGYARYIAIALLANPVVTWLNVLPMGHLFDTTQRALQVRAKNPDQRFDAVSFWFRYQAQHPDKVTTRQIHTQALATVGAGSDTVACAMQSFVYHMLRLPGAWERARGEVDELVSNNKKEGKNAGIVSWADSQQLPYLQACIKEALRVCSPVPMPLTRVAPVGGLVIGNRTIPEGYLVSVSTWAIHYSKEFWGPDAHEFNPDRWLGKNSATLDKYFVPFGAGYNSCPGQHVAKIELSKMLATLVRDYDIEQVDKSQNWTWKAYMTLVPHSWPVYVSKRICHE